MAIRIYLRKQELTRTDRRLGKLSSLTLKVIFEDVRTKDLPSMIMAFVTDLPCFL